MSSEDRYLQVGAAQAPLAFRLRKSTDPRHPAVIMLHGLTGDENSMWALESVVPPDAMLVTPRGPHPQQMGGYAWNRAIQAWPPLLDEFERSTTRLNQLLEYLELQFGLDRQRLILMGFSNGAAMAFAAGMSPNRGPLLGLVAMSGHLPAGRLEPLADLPIFWSHGTRDEFIPIEVARADVARLREIGAPVDYCEAEVGHKLGAGCRQELRSWFQGQFSFASEQLP